MKFRDAHEDEPIVSEREHTGLTVNASGVFEKMDNITLHLLAMESEMNAIYFKTKMFCVLFTIVNLISAVLIKLVIDS